MKRLGSGCGVRRCAQPCGLAWPPVHPVLPTAEGMSTLSPAQGMVEALQGTWQHPLGHVSLGCGVKRGAWRSLSRGVPVWCFSGTCLEQVSWQGCTVHSFCAIQATSGGWWCLFLMNQELLPLEGGWWGGSCWGPPVHDRAGRTYGLLGRMA